MLTAKVQVKVKAKASRRSRKHQEKRLLPNTSPPSAEERASSGKPRRRPNGERVFNTRNVPDVNPSKTSDSGFAIALVTNFRKS